MRTIIEKYLSARSVFLVLCLTVITCAYASGEDARPADSAPPEKTSNRVIRAIEVEGLSRIEREELIDLICFNVGDRLDHEVLSAGIRRAFRKGIFNDIQASAEPFEDGIKLIYLVRETPLVDHIMIEGNENISGREIKKRMLYREGDFFKEEFMDKARDDLMGFYIRKGYPEVRIAIDFENAKKTSMVDINVKIAEGRPLIMKKISIPAEEWYLIKIRDGDIFDKDKVEENIKKLRDHYKKQDYINPVVGPYEFREGELIIPVNKGPKLEVVFKNNSAAGSKELMKEVPFLENEEVTDESVSETVDRIKRLYMSKGYYYAQVAASLERDHELIRVTFIIFEGEKVILKKVGLTGVSVGFEALKKVIPLVEGKPYNDDLVGESRDSLIRFYNALGYLSMNVDDIKKEFLNDGKEAEIEFVITEGPQTKIVDVRITGNKRFSESEVRKILDLNEGSPFNGIDIGDARYRLLSFYGEQGYLNAFVEVESRMKENEAVVSFNITENEPSVVNKVIVSGNLKTKAKIINREIMLEEGSTYRVDEITRIRQRLYKLGIFSEVSIEVLDPDGKADGELKRDMLVSLKEGNSGSVEVGAGYGDYEKFRGSLDISYRNIGGYNRQAGFRTELSEVERKYIFNFREPWLFNWPNVPLKIYLIKEDSRSLNLETKEVLYKTDRTSFIAGVEKELMPGLKIGLDYEYAIVDTKDVQPGVILSKEDTGTIGISSVSPSLFYDTRDNVFDPTSGALNGIVLKYASEALLSETDFIKGTFQSSWYFPVMSRLVFAFALRGGVAYGFGETEEVPLIERFFLGGRTTVRGYSHDTLGPKGSDGNPTGGNIYALTNGELRFALWKGFNLATFLDAGNVWVTDTDLNARLKYTVGAGLRYNTPVGPVRVDYGHKMNKEEGESSGEVHFSFGHAF